MKVLILQNFSTTRPWGQLTLDSISAHIRRIEPDAQIEVCKVADGTIPPDFREYGLIVLTGGTFDLTNGMKSVWVEQVIHLTRNFTAERKEGTKLLGFCWGHQVIHHALGGQIGVAAAGTTIGVELINLNNRGQEWFGAKHLDLHKYHKRCVSVLAPDFTELAENNEIALHVNGHVLTFQSHPELNEDISQNLTDGDDGSYAIADNDAVRINLKPIDAPHDGEKAWKRIMQWTKG